MAGLNTLDMYNIMYGNRPSIRQPTVVKSPEEVSRGLPIVVDARDITLAEYEPITKDAITAHRLKDYRRKSFNLLLVPKVNILFDTLLKGSKYYEELLSTQSPYS